MLPRSLVCFGEEWCVYVFVCVCVCVNFLKEVVFVVTDDYGGFGSLPTPLLHTHLDELLRNPHAATKSEH